MIKKSQLRRLYGLSKRQTVLPPNDITDNGLTQRQTVLPSNLKEKYKKVPRQRKLSLEQDMMAFSRQHHWKEHPHISRKVNLPQKVKFSSQTVLPSDGRPALPRQGELLYFCWSLWDFLHFVKNFILCNSGKWKFILFYLGNENQIICASERSERALQNTHIYNGRGSYLSDNSGRETPFSNFSYCRL